MKRLASILVGGLVLAVAAFATVYAINTSKPRSLENSSSPEMAWLQHEFKLTAEQSRQVESLHEQYRPRCKEMCRKIDEQNGKLSKLLASTNQLTGEIKSAIAESNRLRQECQTAMLEHFYDVAKLMPEVEGKRYLTWVQSRTLGVNMLMNVQDSASGKAEK